MRAQIAHACTSAGRISDIHGLRSPVLRQREAARARTRPVLLSWPLWPSEWNSQWEIPGLMAHSSHRHAPQAMISRHGFLNLSGDVCFVPCYFRKNEHDFRNCNTFSGAITKIRGVQNPTGLALRAVLIEKTSTPCFFGGACFSSRHIQKPRQTKKRAAVIFGLWLF